MAGFHGFRPDQRTARSVEHTPAQGFSDAGKAALSRQLSSAVSRGDTPGVVALVVGRDGVLYEGAAGKLDVAHSIAMPVNAIFSIASMTKPVTSVAIMILFEEGKLKLDDPVSKYLAGFDNLKRDIDAGGVLRVGPMFALGRRLSMIARSESSRLAIARARTTPPTSGETTSRLS